MWYRTIKQNKNQKKSPFGGTIKPHEEVRVLQKRIQNKEATEFAVFEKQFNSQAGDVWGKTEKTQTNIQEVAKSPGLSAKEKLMILSKLQLNLKKLLNKQKKEALIS